MRKRNLTIQLTIILFLALFFRSEHSIAQDPLFTAIVSANKVLQNTVFEIQFELRNANGADFEPPDFKNFRVVGGPSMGSSTMIVNGQVSRSQSWTYSLLAVQAGQFTIGSGNVIAGRRKLASRPIAISVVPADDLATSNRAIPANEPIRLNASVKGNKFYPGQQIVLEYKLLFRENVQTANTLSEDDYADFFIQNFNSFSKEATYETIGNITFASRVLKGVALFPHQSGTYTIDPLVMEIGINAPYPGNQGFFTMRRLNNVQVASAPLSIEVIPLPPNPPENFSGAVGQYSMTTLSVGSNLISTDDDFSLRVEIKGNGDSRRWDPPAMITGGEFEVYDPKIIEDNLLDAGGLVQHSRIVEYRIISKLPGDFKVSLPFTYFDPMSGKYESIYSDIINLKVSQGQNVSRTPQRDSTENAIPLPLRKVSDTTNDDRFWVSVPHLFLFGLIVSGTFWGLFTSYKKRKMNLIPEVERMRSAASRHARSHLDQLSKSSSELSDTLFFEKATEIYNRFLSDKFNISPSDLDFSKIQSIFKSSNINTDVSDRALTFFNQCLSVRYGGIAGGFSREEMITECRHTIDALDASAVYPM